MHDVFCVLGGMLLIGRFSWYCSCDGMDLVEHEGKRNSEVGQEISCLVQ